MHDPGTLGSAGGGNAVAGPGEGTENGGSAPSDRQVRCDPHRLVDHDQVIVVVDDGQLGDVHRHDDGGLARLPGDLEPGTGAKPIRLASWTPSAVTPPASIT